MLSRNIFGDSLFDDFWGFPSFMRTGDTERKLYGKHAAKLMSTDVHESEDHYNVDIDLPGFKKDEIDLSLENGYLTVKASKNISEEDKDEKGTIIRQERYSGSMQRSFYIGEQITEEDIKAKYENGVLSLNFPKNDKKALPEKKTIMIEG